MFKPQAVVLMYHRIATVPCDPWQIAVSPANFEQHLKVLSKRYPVISTNTLIDQLAGGTIKHNSICITFDDGYCDNYLEAAPLLTRYRYPATFFIASAFVGTQSRFWWDELADIFLLSPNLPRVLTITIATTYLQYCIDDSADTETNIAISRSWVWPFDPPTSRCRTYLDIWTRLQPLDINSILPIMDQLRQWSNTISPGNADIPMDSNQLRTLAENGLFNLGMHTHGHAALSYHSPQVQHAEISRCRESLKNILPGAINILAYPYGNYNNETIAVTKKMEISGAFTTEAKPVTNKTGLFNIGRFQVKDCNGAEFERQLDTWCA